MAPQYESSHYDADAAQDLPPASNIFEGAKTLKDGSSSDAPFEPPPFEPPPYDDAYSDRTISAEDLLPETFEVDSATLLKLFRMLEKESERLGSTASARGATRGRANWLERSTDY